MIQDVSDSAVQCSVSWVGAQPQESAPAQTHIPALSECMLKH